MMRGPQDVIRSLGALSADDRRWILQRLSPGTREALLSAGEEPAAMPHEPLDSAGTSESQPEQTRDPLAFLLHWNNSALAAELYHEPAWLVHIVLTNVDHQQRGAVLRLLPSSTRQAVEHLHSSRSDINPKIMEFVLKTFSQHSPSATPSHMSSPFAQLLDRMRNTVARRRT